MSLLNLDWSFGYLIAQSYPESGDFVWTLIIGLAIYVFTSYCFYAMLQKIGYQNPWFAWVPIVNSWATYEAGDQSPWWVIGLFIPLVNIVAAIFLVVAFVNIVKKLGKNPWLILLMIIPLVNFVVQYYFAFG